MNNPTIRAPKVGIVDEFKIRGFVDWELVDDKTGRVVERGIGKTQSGWFRFVPSFILRAIPQSERWFGTENAVVNHARNKLADALIGTSVTFPGFVAVGTGTNTVAASDTALQTVSQYDGANDAKAVASKSLKGQYTSRIIAQFDTDELRNNKRTGTL